MDTQVLQYFTVRLCMGQAPDAPGAVRPGGFALPHFYQGAMPDGKCLPQKNISNIILLETEPDDGALK